MDLELGLFCQTTITKYLFCVLAVGLSIAPTSVPEFNGNPSMEEKGNMDTLMIDRQRRGCMDWPGNHAEPFNS